MYCNAMHSSAMKCKAMCVCVCRAPNVFVILKHVGNVTQGYSPNTAFQQEGAGAQTQVKRSDKKRFELTLGHWQLGDSIWIHAGDYMDEQLML